MYGTEQSAKGGGAGSATESGTVPDAVPNSVQAARQASMAVLARASGEELQAFWQAWSNKPEFEVLRGPETGLVMLRGRIGGGGAPFNVGEATVTRATVRLSDGSVGHSYALGRDQEKARLAAVFDALWLDEGHRDAVEAQVLNVLRKRLDDADVKLRGEAAATKVDFFTMVRETIDASFSLENSTSSAFEGGFDDPVTDAQSAFHAVMHAMANPGRIYPLARTATPPQPLTPELGVIAATLLDHDATVWCDAAIAADESATAWLTFHTGAPRVESANAAQFALASNVSLLPSLAGFSQGDAEFPDRSTTVVLAVASLTSGQGFVLKGPGIDGERALQVEGLPQDFIQQWRENGAQYPLGIDLVLVSDGAVAALPRTTRVSALEG